MSNEIPELAKCKANEDFVLLAAASGYTSQLVRLAAVEKGVNWREFEVSFVIQENFEPWF